MAVFRRLALEHKKLLKEGSVDIMALPDPSNELQWNCMILGPSNTIWEGAYICIAMKFSKEYPIKPPVALFKTKMYHPNIYTDGALCLDILQAQWTPCMTLSTVLLSIQSLLTDPNPSSPANSEAAKKYQSNREQYDREVQACVQQSIQFIKNEPWCTVYRALQEHAEGKTPQ